jgi:hypothetical protein
VLPVEVVALLVGLTWGLVAIFWAVVLHWEKTGVTDARRRELQQQGSEPSSIPIKVWRLAVNTVLVGIPALFAIDGLVYRIGILYSPSLSFLAGPDLALQIVGIICSVVGLAILIGLGRKLAMNVYRLAVHERKMMTTGLLHPLPPAPGRVLPAEPELPRAPPPRRLHDAVGAEAPDVVDARGGGRPAAAVRRGGGGVPRPNGTGVPPVPGSHARDRSGRRRDTRRELVKARIAENEARRRR